MEHLPGESLPAHPSLRTPELSALRPYAARMGAALRATDTIWDNTPPNVMRSGSQYRFIDVKRNASGLPHPPPHVFAQQTLSLPARDPSSVGGRALSTNIGSRETPSAIPALPALRPTFPPKKQKAPASALAPVAEKPRTKLVLPPIGDGRNRR